MTVVFGLWIAMMILVPILSLRGAEHRARAISLGVFVQATTVAVLLIYSIPIPVIAIVMIPLLGWAAEYFGSRTGMLFGSYHYTDRLKPQIGHVPIVVPLAWLMMIPPSWAVAGALVGTDNRLLYAVVGALAFTAWDFYLDPQMVSWGYWRWRHRGIYFGIPVRNFIGWFVSALLISFFLAPLQELPWQLAGVYVLTWLFQLGGQLLFWKLPGPAIGGFLTMAPFAVPMLFRLGEKGF